MDFTINHLTREESHYLNGSDSSLSRSPSPVLNSSGSSLNEKANSSGYQSNKETDRILAAPDRKHDGGSRGEGKKPSHSYIALIAMAILSSPDKKMVLGDIYSFIKNTFPCFCNEKKAWRNSVRHNLSLNECFVKNERAEDGKRNYWCIHQACVDDFSRGDFRRRHARRKARKSMKDTNVNDTRIKSFTFPPGYVSMTSSPIGYHHPYQPQMCYQVPQFSGVPAPSCPMTFASSMYSNYIVPGSAYTMTSQTSMPASPILYQAPRLHAVDLSNAATINSHATGILNSSYLGQSK